MWVVTVLIAPPLPPPPPLRIITAAVPQAYAQMSILVYVSFADIGFILRLCVTFQCLFEMRVLSTYIYDVSMIYVSFADLRLLSANEHKSVRSPAAMTLVPTNERKCDRVMDLKNRMRVVCMCRYIRQCPSYPQKRRVI